MKPIVCFGEIMARLSPPGHLRFQQAMPGSLDVTFAGAEVNAAVTIASLGGRAEFVTALPENEITEACLANLRAARIGVDRIVRRKDGRFGLYFMETGANYRGGNVLYDREHSTFSLTPATAYPWAEIWGGAGWFHTSGISPGVSRVAAEVTIAAVRAARMAGLPVSCDLNYRRKLWRWDARLKPGELGRRTLEEVLTSVDVILGNVADLSQVAGVETPAAEADGVGVLDRAAAVARKVVQRFPQARWVAITLREGCSATHNRWGAMLFRAADRATFVAPTHAGAYAPYDITPIVDRLGAGDAFAGALIFALQTKELAEPETALRFAVASSCLAHSIKGDFNFSTRAEVEALMNGHGGGGVSR